MTKLRLPLAALTLAISALGAITDVSTQTTVTVQPGQSITITWNLNPEFTTVPDGVGILVAGQPVDTVDPSCGGYESIDAGIDASPCKATPQYQMLCSVITAAHSTVFPCSVLGKTFPPDRGDALISEVRGAATLTPADGQNVRTVGGAEIKIMNAGSLPITFGRATAKPLTDQYTIMIIPGTQGTTYYKPFSSIVRVLYDDAQPDPSTFLFTKGTPTNMVQCRVLYTQVQAGSPYTAKGYVCDWLNANKR